MFLQISVFKLLEDVAGVSFDKEESYFDIGRNFQLYKTWLTTFLYIFCLCTLMNTDSHG